MKTSSKTMLSAAILSIALAAGGCGKSITPGLAQNDYGKVAEQPQLTREEQEARLGQYTVNMMFKARAYEHMSKGRILIVARNIVRVANDILSDDYEKQKDWVLALYIESQFRRFAQSPTGPKGYGQLAKDSFHEAMKHCGIPEVHSDDVWETEMNLYASACYFKKTLIAAENDSRLAIIGYNQGVNSESFKSYKKYGEMKELEPMKYLVKITFLQGVATDQKVPGVPAIEELPKPVAPKAPDSIELKVQ